MKIRHISIGMLIKILIGFFVGLFIVVIVLGLIKGNPKNNTKINEQKTIQTQSSSEVKLPQQTSKNIKVKHLYDSKTLNLSSLPKSDYVEAMVSDMLRIGRKADLTVFLQKYGVLDSVKNYLPSEESKGIQYAQYYPGDISDIGVALNYDNLTTMHVEYLVSFKAGGIKYNYVFVYVKGNLSKIVPLQ